MARGPQGRNQQVISTGYTPRPIQKLIHRSLKRFNVLVCHRRFGKTVLVINEIVDLGLRCDKKNPQYAYLAPTYAAAKRIAWEYFIEATRNLPGVKVNIADLSIEIPRPGRKDKIKIMLLGAENPNSLRGIYLMGAVLDEFAEYSPDVWTKVIRPTLSDHKGWAIFIGTPKGKNHFYDIYHDHIGDPDWYQAIYKASETNIIDEEELDSARRGMSEEDFEQEYECSWSAALKGSYYAKLMHTVEKEGRVREVPYDPNLLVHTWFDLGIGDSTAVWFAQFYNNQIRLIDYEEYSGVGIPTIAKKVLEKPYVYHRFHNLPHDAAARSLDTGRTRQETFEKYGMKSEVHQRQAVDDGINAARLIIPKCVFDTKKTLKGREALINYSRKWNSKDQIFSQKPKHDWASHGADAFRLLGSGYREEFDSRVAKINRPRYSEMDYNEFA